MSGHSDIGMRDFDRSLPMALLKAREATMRRFRPMLASHDLTEQQWRVLRALSGSDAPLEVGLLADRTFLLGPSLSRILSNLEGRRLIRRRTVAHDQRRAVIALTVAGRRLVRTVAPKSEAIYAQIEQAFGSTDLDALLRQLESLAAIDGAVDGLHEAS